MFITEPALSHPYEVGEPEPTRSGSLIIDADNKQVPQIAHDEVRRLCCFFLPENYGIDPWDIRFFCSGGKGFHAEIPARFFGLEDGHPELPLIYKRLVQGWVDELGLTTLDLSVYCMGKGKMWRLPYVRRANGRMKVPLTRDDVAFCSFDELWRLTEAPRRA
jgi:hypothetical protein